MLSFRLNPTCLLGGSFPSISRQQELALLLNPGSSLSLLWLPITLSLAILITRGTSVGK